MNFFFVINGKRFKQYLIIAIAALFAAAILFVERGQQPVFSTKTGPKAIYQGSEETNKVALTFDISWGDKKALPILEVLQKEGISNATFFLSASWAERHPEIVKKIVESGYEIGSMGYRFKSYTEMDDNEIKKDLLYAQQIFEKITGKRPSLLRPPNGHFDTRVLNITESLKFDVVHWNKNSEDWTNPGVDKIVSNVINNLDGGDIILLHASDSAKQTAEALPKIISQIKSKGHSFATISSMIANAESKSKEEN
ncbi:polysaccharide deacetylase family sporulation protein PdaB [Lottiidibacillus patelloidae]|uniref:Polysaccharide deacetylase family sporulation protein PdaB n=1 Tax=Lottiidibacillus patelloidae TaxID=2670334 RepID=A0A263BQG1_9BACI|nr:polysaccharide deacetylase family sporulation protein PdaB [Lottiidibacillus patelloidae]OZM55953.1 polysaccharide deacetylase family sporulation protein PdaB [Lottiidibacillus patelloidae]